MVKQKFVEYLTTKERGPLVFMLLRVDPSKIFKIVEGDNRGNTAKYKRPHQLVWVYMPAKAGIFDRKKRRFLGFKNRGISWSAYLLNQIIRTVREEKWAWDESLRKREFRRLGE